MTMNAKVFVAGLALLAVVAAPAVAMARTHYPQVHHSRGWHRAPSAWGYAGPRAPLRTHYGNIRDRQTYGLGY
jgi:hypothetical protein